MFKSEGLLVIRENPGAAPTEPAAFIQGLPANALVHFCINIGVAETAV